MTIEELIQKMKDSKIKTWKVFENWLTDKERGKCERYNKVYGFLWGLYSTGFITESEMADLTKYLLDEQFKE